jgi:hypothetical protein
MYFCLCKRIDHFQLFAFNFCVRLSFEHPKINFWIRPCRGRRGEVVELARGDAVGWPAGGDDGSAVMSAQETVAPHAACTLARIFSRSLMARGWMVRLGPSGGARVFETRVHTGVLNR